MSRQRIEPRSNAAEDMRDALDHAEWLVVESQARGHELSWDAAVGAGASIVVAREVYYGLNRLPDTGLDEPDEDAS